jgi:hypothetical protein
VATVGTVVVVVVVAAAAVVVVAVAVVAVVCRNAGSKGGCRALPHLLAPNPFVIVRACARVCVACVCVHVCVAFPCVVRCVSVWVCVALRVVALRVFCVFCVCWLLKQQQLAPPFTTRHAANSGEGDRASHLAAADAGGGGGT